MKAAPELQSLSLRRFVDSHTYGTHTSLASIHPAHYVGLPENKITKLDLQQSWFRFQSLKQLLSNFPNLRQFRLTGLSFVPWDVPDDITVRAADSHEVAILLEPLRSQLEVLELNFHSFPRPILSLTAFTALKTIRLGQSCLGMPPEPDYASLLQGFTFQEILGSNFEEILDLLEARRADTNDLLVKALPRLLESLQIDGFADYFEESVVEFARRASLKEYPHLKHVRLVSDNMSFMGEEELERDIEPYHGIQSLGPPSSRNHAEVRRAIINTEVDLEARNYFLKAGVKFETLELGWPGLGTGNFIRVYPQASIGDCDNPNCGGQALEKGGSQ
ncbi:hypothetical protein Daus18300_009248 [Diaporthe australafricana]|uniref:F-box domain-containing protein n=1 Tax=Diaporthe australafricana TaxID=127596 RepID=A0ABR3WEP8_9PEZI